MAIRDLVNRAKSSMFREQNNGQHEIAVRGRDDRDLALSPFGGFDLLSRFQREMNRLFDDFMSDLDRWPRFPSLWSGEPMWQGFTPSVDVKDDGKEIRVIAELPGIDEKDLDVELTGDLLTIRGEKREEIDEDREGWRRIERRFGSFERTISLPEGIDTEKVKAHFKNGVLTVSLPRRPEAQVERRKITVETGVEHTTAEKKAA